MFEPFSKLSFYWGSLMPRERIVLLEFAKRLLAGQESYGPLTKGKKRWAKEAYEEALDMAVYLTCATLDLEDEKLEHKLTSRTAGNRKSSNRSGPKRRNRV